MMRSIGPIVGAAFLCLSTQCAFAVDYHFCVSSDTRSGNVITSSSIADYGHDWYQVKTAESFCFANGATGCAASDFSAATCGTLTEEHLDFYWASEDQAGALFSGDPFLMGQASVEIVTGIPVEAAKSVGTIIIEKAEEVCSWVHVCN
jgi:hypothetical protein